MDNEYFEIYGEPVFYDDIRMYAMPKITNEHLHRQIGEVKIVLLGVPDSEDMGLYGEVKDIKKLVKEMNGMVKGDHAWVMALKWIVGLLILGVGACLTGYMGVW